MITGIIWTRQFRIWARFSEAPFIKSFYFLGVALIILFLDQVTTTTLQFFLYWAYPEASIGAYSIEFQAIIMILLLIAIVVLPVYIYFLTMAGESMRIPHDTVKPKSRKVIILPLVFFFLWFLFILVNVGGEAGDPVPIFTLLGNVFLVAAFIPISIRFIGHARRVDSVYLRKNLYLAAVRSLALSTFSVVGPKQWTGMAVLTGYLLSFSILTWSLANISQFLGSREALSRRLRLEKQR